MAGVNYSDETFWSHKIKNSVNFFNFKFHLLEMFCTSPEVAYSTYLCIPKLLQERK